MFAYVLGLKRVTALNTDFAAFVLKYYLVNIVDGVALTVISRNVIYRFFVVACVLEEYAYLPRSERLIYRIKSNKLFVVKSEASDAVCQYLNT